MTAPTKAAPKARGRKPANERPKINFDALTVVESEVPTRQGTGASILDGTPVLGWIDQSWQGRKPRNKRLKSGETVTVEQGSGRKITLPSAQVDHMTRLLRLAAAKRGLGVKIVTGEANARGHVDVVFAAKTKDKRARKAS